MQNLTNQLRAYRLASDELPLADERQPFAMLSNQVITKVVAWKNKYPAKTGRLSDIVDEVSGNKSEPADSFWVIEAHLDSEQSLTSELIPQAIALGFEPDNFEKFNPPNYRDHWTMRFEIPKSQGKKVFDEIRQITESAMHNMAQAIQQSTTSGYIEFEIYSSDTITNYETRAPTDDSVIEAFPYPAESLENLETPMTEQEALSSILPLDACKAADIHIKTPSEFQGTRYGHFQETPLMSKLRDKIKTAGFYEVMTEAGHIVYTGQFLHMREAKVVCAELQSYFARSRGVAQIYLEPCVSFWRKQDIQGHYAKLPPLVRFKT